MHVGTSLQSTIKKEGAVLGMKSAAITQIVKSSSEEYSSQAGKSEMPDNIASLVKTKGYLFYDHFYF